jgi:hypothetical protein
MSSDVNKAPSPDWANLLENSPRRLFLPFALHVLAPARPMIDTVRQYGRTNVRPWTLYAVRPSIKFCCLSNS